MRRKLLIHHYTMDEILAYSRLSPKEKLDWLEMANRFTHKWVTGERKKIWESLRRGGD